MRTGSAALPQPQDGCGCAPNDDMSPRDPCCLVCCRDDRREPSIWNDEGHEEEEQDEEEVIIKAQAWSRAYVTINFADRVKDAAPKAAALTKKILPSCNHVPQLSAQWKGRKGAPRCIYAKFPNATSKQIFPWRCRCTLSAGRQAVPQPYLPAAVSALPPRWVHVTFHSRLPAGLPVDGPGDGWPSLRA